MLYSDRQHCSGIVPRDLFLRETRSIEEKGREAIVNDVRGSKGALTASERRVLRLISQSKTNREIAVDLSISPATVKRHVENILRKLHLRNRVEAAIYALTLNGCPARGQVRCPLDLWREICHSLSKIGPVDPWTGNRVQCYEASSLIFQVQRFPL